MKQGVARPGTARAREALAEGFELVESLVDFATSPVLASSSLPEADVERFAPDLLTDRAAAVESAAIVRLVRYEIEQADGLLDAATSVLGDLDTRQRLATAARVGRARAQLQALRRRPDAIANGVPRPWRISQALATFRALRRAHHWRRTPHHHWRRTPHN